MVVAPLILICIYFLQACSSSVLDPSPSLSPKCPVVDISHSVIPIATPWLVLHHPKLLFPLHGMVKYSITGKEFPYGHILVDFPHFSIFRAVSLSLNSVSVLTLTGLLSCNSAKTIFRPSWLVGFFQALNLKINEIIWLASHLFKPMESTLWCKSSLKWNSHWAHFYPLIWKFQESCEWLQIRNGAGAVVIIINQVLLSYRLSYVWAAVSQTVRAAWQTSLKEADYLISCLGEPWCKLEGEIHNMKYSAVPEPWGHCKTWCSWRMIVSWAVVWHLGTPKERWDFWIYMIILNRWTL